MVEPISLHIAISGRVQGVGFRAWLARNASALGLSGWVRNCHTGEVEAVLCGPEEAVQTMISHCWQGPRGTRVDAVDILGDAPPAQGQFAIVANR